MIHRDANTPEDLELFPPMPPVRPMDANGVPWYSTYIVALIFARACRAIYNPPHHIKFNGEVAMIVPADQIRRDLNFFLAGLQVGRAMSGPTEFASYTRAVYQEWKDAAYPIRLKESDWLDAWISAAFAPHVDNSIRPQPDGRLGVTTEEMCKACRADNPDRVSTEFKDDNALSQQLVGRVVKTMRARIGESNKPEEDCLIKHVRTTIRRGFKPDGRPDYKSGVKGIVMAAPLGIEWDVDRSLPRGDRTALTSTNHRPLGGGPSEPTYRLSTDTTKTINV